MTGEGQTRERLWTRGFSVLWWSESVSFLGSQLTMFAIPIVALDQLGASASDVAWINAAAGLGTLIFLGLLGPLTDRGRRDRLMSWTSLLRAGVMGLVAAGLFTGNLSLWALAFAALIVTGLTGLYDSAFAALLPHIAPRSRLAGANSWVAGIRSAGDIGAGAAAGILLQFFSPVLLFVADAVTYVASAFAVRKVGEPASPDLRTEPFRWGPYAASLFSGFRLLKRQPVMWPLTLSIAQFNLFTTAIQAVYITHALKTGAMTPAEVGVAGAVGGVLGLSATLVAPALWDRVRPVWALSASFALPLLSAVGIACLSPGGGLLNIVLLAVSLGFWSACVMVNITGTETLKQILVPDESVGKFSAASRLLTWGIDPVGAALAGVLTLFLPTSGVLLIAAAGVATSVIWTVRAQAVRDLGLLSTI